MKEKQKGKIKAERVSPKKETTKMKKVKEEKKLHKEIFKIGTEHVNLHQLKFFEIAAILSVAFLSISAGLAYGMNMFPQ